MIQKNDTILFIGDSITHAHRRPEEIHDCYYLGSGYVNHLAGYLQSRRPDWHLRFINNGECGHGARELRDRWDRDCLNLKPEVISILIGVNDSHPNQVREQSFGPAYREILQRTRSALPKARLILLEPFALNVGNAVEGSISEAQLNNLPISQRITASLAREFGATFVPLQDEFYRAAQSAPASHWALDGIHPSVAGHALIARQWLRKVEGIET